MSNTAVIDINEVDTNKKEKTQEAFINEKNYKILETAADYAGIFRENPHLFVEYYLNIHLKDFQKVLLWEMFHNDYGIYVASRGQGKTFEDAIFASSYAILYPRTKIVVAAATREQGNQLLLKITKDLMKNYDWGSDNLRREIEGKPVVTLNKGEIYFKNGSWIKVVTPSDNARGARANILINQLSGYIEIYNCNRAKSKKAK